MRPIDRLRVFAPLAIAALVAVAPSPAPSASPAAARTLQVVCERTPLWLFVPGDDRPRRAPEPDAMMGQRFALVSGPRTTLGGFDYYETDIVIVEPGLHGHYWLSQRCAIPST